MNEFVYTQSRTVSAMVMVAWSTRQARCVRYSDFVYTNNQLSQHGTFDISQQQLTDREALPMVSQSTTVSSRKRKLPTAMTESPPKRMTRARTKASEDSEQGIKITTASVRAGATGRTPAKPVRVAQRKSRTVLPKPDTIQAQAEADLAAAEPIKTRGRPKKTLIDPPTEKDRSNPSLRTRGRQEQPIKIVEKDSNEVAKPIARSRKPKEANLDRATHGKDATIEAQVSKKPTRARAQTVKVKAESMTVSNPTTGRKKVTFQDQSRQDKENILHVSEATKNNGAKLTGLRAKPVRKPASGKTGVRGKKSIADKATNNDSENNGESLKPLSPKKVTQIAKSSSISSDDELCGERTFVRAMSKSPVKAQVNILHSQPQSSPRCEASTTARSPIKVLNVSAMISPARRPPPSPFKDCLKASPRRGHLEGSTASQPVFEAVKTPMKVSPMKSPARRPVSPSKAIAFGSSGKSSMTALETDAASSSKVPSIFRLPNFTPRPFLSSPRRAEKSTEHLGKVLKMKPVEAEEEAQSGAGPVVEKSQISDCAKDVTDVMVEEPSMDFRSQKWSAVAAENLLGSPMVGVETTKTVQIASQAAPEDEMENPTATLSTTPPGEPGKLTAADAHAFSHESPLFRSTFEDSDSEDELQSGSAKSSISPLRKYNVSVKDFGARTTPTPDTGFRTPKTTIGGPYMLHQSGRSSRAQHGQSAANGSVSITPLAVQLSSWLASSPEKSETEQTPSRGIFSFVATSSPAKPVGCSQAAVMETPPKATFFEDEMIVRDQEAASSENETWSDNKEPLVFEASQESHDSEEYGDENAIPVDTELLQTNEAPLQSSQATCTPARVFQAYPREIHTVSKVPLKPSADDSPLRVPRKRSRSVSTPAASVDELTRPASGRSISMFSPNPDKAREPLREHEHPFKKVAAADLILHSPSTPVQHPWFSLGSPARTVRKGADAQILRGAVVYVDVHTTEGADASGIFVELLTQMGAKCVKQWNWNPSATVSTNSPDVTPTGSGAPFDQSISSRKVGITHVVFKDGGKRTLEKIRESKGLVLPVGVGWVLEYVFAHQC